MTFFHTLYFSISSLAFVAALSIAAADEPAKPAINFVGDERSLSAVEAAPLEWLNRPFVAVGSAEIGDLYAFGYREAHESHYCLHFTQRNASNPRKRGERCYLFVPRTEAGKKIAAKIISQDGNAERIRVKVALLAERYAADKEWICLELLDAAFPDDADEDGWGEWVVGSSKPK